MGYNEKFEKYIKKFDEISKIIQSQGIYGRHTKNEIFNKFREVHKNYSEDEKLSDEGISKKMKLIKEIFRIEFKGIEEYKDFCKYRDEKIDKEHKENLERLKNENEIKRRTKEYYKNGKENKDNEINKNINKIKELVLNNNLIQIYDKKTDKLCVPIIINYYNNTVTYIRDNNNGKIVLDYLDTEPITKKIEDVILYINTNEKDKEGNYIFKRE